MTGMGIWGRWSVGGILLAALTVSPAGWAAEQSEPAPKSDVTEEATPDAYDHVLEFFLGSAYSFPSRLTVYQSGQPTISHDATWSTPTFSQAPYYSIRFGWWRKEAREGWEVEDLHHKVQLANPPSEIASYKVTFGYNIFAVNRAWKRWGFVFRAGLGLVIAHPINTVRGQRFDSTQGGILGTEYFLTGIAAVVGAQRRWTVWKSLFLTLEAKYSLAYANIPVANGVSTFANHALHGLFGLGWVFE